MAILAGTAVGCAGRTATPFVLKGPGFIDVGGPVERSAPAITPEAWERAKRDALAARRSAPANRAPGIEDIDASLRAALARVSSGTAADHVSVAFAYNRLGVRDLAYEHYSRALSVEPHYVPALDGRARLLRDVGLLAMALSDAHRARFVAPTSSEVRITLGTILEHLGQCREALTVYRQAAALGADGDLTGRAAERPRAGCTERGQ